MTSYRAMDGVSGRPGTGSSGTQPPGTATSFTGSYTAGLTFTVTQGGCWLEGYWWWVPSAGSPPTAAQKFALWSVFAQGPHQAVPVSAATVTSGTLSAGWNYVPLAAPVQVAPGMTYVAATSPNGNFPDTTHQFGAGNPYASGITNGPLTVPASGASFAMAQSPFSASVSDPAAGFPDTNDLDDLLWLDVQVTDTAPPGYAGSWRLWPNSGITATTGGDNASTFILATEVHLSQACTLNAVWYYSLAGAASLATWAGVYDIGSQTAVAANTSPAWKKPDGTSASAGSGWVYCTFAGVTLAAGSYKAAYYNSGGAGGSWSSRDFGYWLTGPGASGITNGPLSAPAMGAAATAYVFTNNGGAGSPPWTGGFGSEAQNGTFALTGPQYPYMGVDYRLTSGQDPAGAVAESFWADMEVTPVVQQTQPPFAYQMRFTG